MINLVNYKRREAENLILYKETINELTKLNNGINNYKSHTLSIQKARLVRDLISKGILEKRK
jgi:hypothetical protein